MRRFPLIRTRGPRPSNGISKGKELLAKDAGAILHASNDEPLASTAVTPFPHNQINPQSSSNIYLFRYCLALGTNDRRLFCLQHAKIILKSLRLRPLPRKWWTSDQILEGWKVSLIEWLCTYYLIAKGCFSPRNLHLLVNFHATHVPYEFAHQAAFLVTLAKEVKQPCDAEFHTYAERLGRCFQFVFEPLPQYLEETLKPDGTTVGVHVPLVNHTAQEAWLQFHRSCTFGQFWRMYYLFAQRLQGNAPQIVEIERTSAGDHEKFNPAAPDQERLRRSGEGGSQ